LEFGPDGTNNVMTNGMAILPFRIRVDSQSAGIKIISWGTLEQEPTTEYAKLPLTFVYISDAYDAECSGCLDKRATPSTAYTQFEMFNGTTYLPISVKLSNSPSVDVEVGFEITYDDEDNQQSAGTVVFAPEAMTYLPWEQQQFFNVSVVNWDFTKGTAKFYVNFKFGGTDGAAYKAPSSTQLEFTVMSLTSYTPNPTITLAGEIVPKKWSWTGLTATSSGEGYVWCLTLPKDVVGPTTGA
jgi:hypothetical protein